MDPLDELAEEVPVLQRSFDSAFVLDFGGGFGLTQYTVYVILVAIIVLLVVLMVGRRLTLIPKGKFTNMVEYGYDLVHKDIGESTIGHGYRKHIPFLATIFFFILVANFIGLIPGSKTATGTISVTWALAIASFVYFNCWGVKPTVAGATSSPSRHPACLRLWCRLSGFLSSYLYCCAHSHWPFDCMATCSQAIWF